MPNRPPKPEGYSWIVTTLTVKDIEKSLAFYEKAFGFQKGMTMPGPAGKAMHGEMTYKDIKVMLGPEGEWEGKVCKSPASSKVESPSGLYVYVEDVDALYKRATGAGAVSVVAPADQFWGDRMC